MRLPLMFQKSKAAKFVFPALLLLSTSSCGLKPPEIKEPFDKDVPPSGPEPGLSGSAILEFEIQKKVYCELGRAVRTARKVQFSTGDSLKDLKSNAEIFLAPDWIAEVSLTFQVDESSSLNPGLASNTPLPNILTGYGGTAPPSTFAQSFGLGLGATLSSTGTTSDKYDPFWTIDYLSKEPEPDSICKDSQKDPVLKYSGINSPFLIEGKLGLEEWLVGALFVHDSLLSIGSPAQVVGSPAGAHPDTITREIKFIVVTSGNITPTWRLVRVSANTSSTPFFGANRTRTHDLIITIGPNKAETSYTHLASQIGNSVSNSNRPASGQ